MKHFPIFVGTQDQRIVVIGGGEAATQKVRLLVRTQARIEIFAETLTEELRALAVAGQVHHAGSGALAGDLSGARLAIVSTGTEAADREAAGRARAAGVLVNVVDRPALSDFTMPALVDRDPVVVAIGTEGTSPVLARQIKTRIERMLEPSLGAFAVLLGGLRARVAMAVAPAERRRFWEWAVTAPRRAFNEGGKASAMAHLDAAIEGGSAPNQTQGRITLIDPSGGAADLMTLRAVERLQTADLIVHGPDCATAILDLARRDAERLALDTSEEPTAWHRERAWRLAESRAAEGHQVVWLLDDGVVRDRLVDAEGTIETVPSVGAEATGPSVLRPLVHRV